MFRKIIEQLLFSVSQTIRSRALERSWGRLWGVVGCLGQSWRVLGAFWACFGRVLERWKVSWRCLEASWRRLGAVLGRLGASWGVLGASWRPKSTQNGLKKNLGVSKGTGSALK